jgi:hypothetical protein
MEQDYVGQEWEDLLPHVEDSLRSGEFEQGEIEMKIGMKVIRKADAKRICTAFGIVDGIMGKKAYVRWTYNGRDQHSTLVISSLLEVTPEIEQDLRAKSRAKYEARKAELDRERIYICQNVNPLARVSNDGHPRPLPLTSGQVVDGKCWYCKHPVVLREQV